MLATSRLSRVPCLVALLAAVTGSGLASHAAAQQPSPPPASAVPAATRDLRAELDRLAADLQKLEPTAPDYNARSKTILQRLIEVNQALLRENAALRDHLSASPAATAAPAGGPASRGAAASPSRGGPKPMATPAPQAAVPLAPGAYFGSKERRTLHRAGCRFGDQIHADNRIVFPTAAAAAAAGYTPCKICHPDLPAPPPK